MRSGFQRQFRVVPPVLKGKKREFQKFNNEFLLKANTPDISGPFIGQGTRAVPVSDPLEQRAVLLRGGFSSEETRGAYQAWNPIHGALQSEAGSSILKRCKSPTDVFDHLEKWHDLESEVANQIYITSFIT